MAGNRVDELEAKVQELEATIDGLTDELVETKERLHALEGEEPTNDILEGRPTRSEAQQETATEPAGDAPAEPDESPEDAEAESAEDGKDEAADGEDEADSESGDDIIVA